MADLMLSPLLRREYDIVLDGIFVREKYLVFQPPLDSPSMELFFNLTKIAESNHAGIAYLSACPATDKNNGIPGQVSSFSPK